MAGQSVSQRCDGIVDACTILFLSVPVDQQIECVQDAREQDEVLIPSFQDAFNEAFQTASESVWAAHKGEISLLNYARFLLLFIM